MNKILLRVTLCGSAMILSGCAALGPPALDSIVDALAKGDCEMNAVVKVGKNKKVLLFVKHHIYVAGTTTTWNPNEYTKIVYPPVSWKNQDLVKKRVAQIKNGTDETNKIFHANGVNIQIFNKLAGWDVPINSQFGGHEIVVDDKMIPATVHDSYGALGYTRTVVDAIAQAEPQYIHIHWSLTGVQPGGRLAPWDAIGRNFYVVVTDNPRAGGSTLNSSDFAHEIVHALGYENHDAGTFMDGGTTLTMAQIQVMWDTINGKGKKLLSLSCNE